MSRSEADLVATLSQAEQMHHGEAQTSLMEDVVRHADAGGHHRLAFAARRSLASAYSVDRQWDKAFPLFSRCLSEYDSRPGDFGPEEDYALRRWYTSIAQSMAEFPEISLTQIYGAFEDMERRFRAGGHSLVKVHAARRWVAQLARDWGKEERSYRDWKAAGGLHPDSVWDFEEEVERLVLRGDDASVGHALDLATPVLAGERTFTEPPAPIQCLMLLPLARAGRHEEAAKAFQRSRRTMEHGVYRYEYSGMHIEFCALTGNEDTGLSVLRERLLHFRTLNRPNGKMEFATATAVLCRQLAATGRGTETIRANGSELRWSVVQLHQEMDDIARDLAAKFDARNGATWQGDAIRARLVAEPVVDFLPLAPGARKPVRPALPPPGTPPEAVLDRAEQHHARQEMAAARACLAAIGAPAPHLAARHAMLTALTDWDGDGVEQRLRWAADAFGRTGDQRRQLLSLCWLGAWLSEHDRVREGLPMVANAIDALRRTGDNWAIATGELEHARTLVRAGQDKQSYQATARAATHAQQARDPMLLGSVALVEAGWREFDKFAPDLVLALAATARDAFAAAGAPEQQIRAYEQARGTYQRAGTPGAFVELVERDLTRLPPNAPASVRGYLRYRRGVAMIAAGRAAQALDDLIDGVGEAKSRDADTAEQGYQLAVAYQAAGRHEDAVHAADDVTTWLDRLREHNLLDTPAMADWNRLLLAESHSTLGDHHLALEEYQKLTAGARERQDPQLLVISLVGSAESLDKLDHDLDAAQAYRAAGDLAQAHQDAHTVAQCRAGEALSLHWVGAHEQALTVLAEADQATRSLPAQPADRLALQQAMTLRSAAYVLTGAGRLREAVDQSAAAAAALRRVGMPVEAAKMDLQQGRILAAEHPDHAVPVLRAALHVAADIPPLRHVVAHTLADALDRLGQSAEATQLRNASA
ncbi:MAG: hypothetical protein ACRDTQ_14250 [Micromonosporaceae bacterium]